MTVTIHFAESVLGVVPALVCRESKPLGRFGVVLWDAPAYVMIKSEMELRWSKSLIGSLAIRLHCLAKIPAQLSVDTFAKSTLGLNFEPE